ncbi:hypothetical protein GCM10010466_35260 [Planomonospora alba]|uniref:Uncharacterized protein n=1 Tax=Planomonospora alba TaxID=161354 RepID=A0ABP6NBR8_9ACTN
MVPRLWRPAVLASAFVLAACLPVAAPPTLASPRAPATAAAPADLSTPSAEPPARTRLAALTMAAPRP